jgi:DNA adenine methylase
MSPSSAGGAAEFRLKWAGGKRWLAEDLANGLGLHAFAEGLCEPFAGGAALFFATRPRYACLGDANIDLIRTYEAVRAAPRLVAASLENLAIGPEEFQSVRAWRPETEPETAARFIYLNRTAFAGLWRVNRRGEFNVPYGCKPGTRLPTVEELEMTSQLLAGVVLRAGDFENVSSSSQAATTYFDPPYTTAHNSNGFVRYNETIFSWADQGRLARHATALAADRRNVIVSNAWHSEVRELYPQEFFKFYRVARRSNLAARSSSRGRVEELLIVSRNLRFRSLPNAISMAR